MDTQGFVTVQHKKARKNQTRTPPRRRGRQTSGWSKHAGQDPAQEWAEQLGAFQPQADVAAWQDTPVPEEDDPPTALTPHNLKKHEPQCEFNLDRLHYWIPFWRDCVSLALDGRDFPTTMEFYDKLYEEVGRLGWKLNGGYGPVVETGWGLSYNGKWGNASDAGWKGGNGFGWGRKWADPVADAVDEGWNASAGNGWNAVDAQADGRQNDDGENGWSAEREQEERKPAAKRPRRRRPARGKRTPQGAADQTVPFGQTNRWK